VARKRDILARALARHPDATDPLDVLATFGGFEIAAMTGAYLAAAASRMVILVDGFIASAALLVAARIDPNVLQYCVFSHCSHEQGHRALLAEFGRAAAGAGPAPGRGHRRRAGVAAGGFGRRVPARDGHVQRRGRQQRVGDLKRPDAMMADELRFFLTAVGYFTRVPLPRGWRLGGVRAALPERRARYFPLVGLLVGASGAGDLGRAAFWSPSVAIVLGMAATLLLTGAFHEDGLADCVDAFGGGYRREDVLRSCTTRAWARSARSPSWWRCC
jgi:hypothetical protein